MNDELDLIKLSIYEAFNNGEITYGEKEYLLEQVDYMYEANAYNKLVKISDASKRVAIGAFIGGTLAGGANAVIAGRKNLLECQGKIKELIKKINEYENKKEILIENKIKIISIIRNTNDENRKKILNIKKNEINNQIDDISEKINIENEKLNQIVELCNDKIARKQIMRDAAKNAGNKGAIIGAGIGALSGLYRGKNKY